jgi:hypothetical protein
MGSTNVTAVYVPRSVTAYNDDATAIASAQALESAGDLTLDGDAVTDGVATFPRARYVTITAAGDVTAVNFTITGTDLTGAAQTETIAGPNGDVSVTTKFFLTVTQISGDASTSAVDVSAGAGEGFAVQVFSGASRIKGLYTVFGESNRLLDFRKGSAEGEIALAVHTAGDNDGQDIMIPEMGIRYETGCVLTYLGVNAFKGLTVFHA